MSLSGDISSAMPLVAILLPALAIVVLWATGYLNTLVYLRQGKGDIQRPATYAYGSVRQYPKVSLYRKAEEFFYYTYYRLFAIYKSGRMPPHVLYGENFIEEFLVTGIQLKPRVVVTPMRARGTALDIDWMGDWKKSKQTNELINAASFDYGGFGFLEAGAVDVLANCVTRVPHVSLEGTELIAQAACEAGARFLGYDFCHFATSGYTMNLLAFPALANAGTAQGKKTIFFMDSSNHNSMFVGGYVSKNARLVRFIHNDIVDLEEKLASFADKPDLNLVVAIEGNYSMEGGLPPLPAIVALKKQYGFQIYIDEAHSFLSIGNTGRGIIEHYQDLGHALSASDVDCVGATLSKSAGTVGGVIVTSDSFLSQHLTLRDQEWQATGGGGELPTVVKMRMMQIWKKEEMIKSRMAALKQHTTYILESLHHAGLVVHSDYLSPVIVIITITLSGCARFGAECRRLGLAVTMAGPPATELWRSVGRLCINALLSPDDVEQVVKLAVQAAVNTGVTDSSALKRIQSLRYNFKELGPAKEAITVQNATVDSDLRTLLDRQVVANRSKTLSLHKSHLLESARQVLESQGVGSSSVRLFWGTQLAHVKCEHVLGQLHPSLTKALKSTHAMIMTDARNAVTSTLAACISPLADKKGYHLVLIPQSAGPQVLEALMSMKKSAAVGFTFYDNVMELGSVVGKTLDQNNKRVHLTVMLETLNGSEPIFLPDVLSQLRNDHRYLKRISGVQILLNDSQTFGRLGSKRLGYLNWLADKVGENGLKSALDALEKPIRFLVMGSFHEAFGLQGGFVISEEYLIKVLHWTSRAFIFSTAPLPYNIEMARLSVEQLQQGAIPAKEQATATDSAEQIVASLAL
ncbi:pyridoxal phosphate-dependent transferase [Protomyces lactucae-debilis]|uniref:Pyridoxal phosphate-dependent transferase n=1 Tax=Protomyces lactucae-debilis TaxID=2754530 RepID=A0A1Y2ERL6_PROLT|nr:pyridoxal phosphate-dependent transferase [Protomyces lactucae-debilis]ORY73924.1 pyridoxal phosphate-dependent transferase [Protomyces lactucae-debilis]